MTDARLPFKWHMCINFSLQWRARPRFTLASLFSAVKQHLKQIHLVQFNFQNQKQLRRFYDYKHIIISWLFHVNTKIFRLMIKILFRQFVKLFQIEYFHRCSVHLDNTIALHIRKFSRKGRSCYI